jgi:predicted DNA-binding transcriptional regulator AlpA
MRRKKRTKKEKRARRRHYQETHDQNRIYRVWDLAKLLTVHEMTIWKWAQKGLLPPPTKFGPGVTAWRASDIEAWQAAKAKEAQPQEVAEASA